jgi:hypothetical protein
MSTQRFSWKECTLECTLWLRHGNQGQLACFRTLGRCAEPQIAVTDYCVIFTPFRSPHACKRPPDRYCIASLFGYNNSKLALQRERVVTGGVVLRWNWAFGGVLARIWRATTYRCDGNKVAPVPSLLLTGETPLIGEWLSQLPSRVPMPSAATNQRPRA